MKWGRGYTQREMPSGLRSGLRSPRWELRNKSKRAEGAWRASGPIHTKPAVPLSSHKVQVAVTRTEGVPTVMPSIASLRWRPPYHEGPV